MYKVFSLRNSCQLIRSAQTFAYNFYIVYTISYIYLYMYLKGHLIFIFGHSQITSLKNNTTDEDLSPSESEVINTAELRTRCDHPGALKLRMGHPGSLSVSGNWELSAVAFPCNCDTATVSGLI